MRQLALVMASAGGHAHALLASGHPRMETTRFCSRKPADWNVEYRPPGPIFEVPIPFEFKDVPLP
jgi:hypothetical protein